MTAIAAVAALYLTPSIVTAIVGAVAAYRRGRA